MQQHTQRAQPSQTSPPAAPRRSIRWRWVVLALVLAAIGGAEAWHRIIAAQTPALQGALLTQPVTAYDFTLPGADGRDVSLSSFKGKVVVLTFLYARCPDVCPLIADQLHRIYQRLGDTARHAAFVAVSVDPAGDTPAAVRDFLKTHRVEGELTYLRGTAAQLRPVWARYFVGSDAGQRTSGASAGSQTSAGRQIPATPQTPPATPLPGQIGHTSIVYVIDQQGQVRLFLPANFDPKDLEGDVRALVARGSH